MYNEKISKSLYVSLILFGIMCLYFICLVAVPANRSGVADAGLKGPVKHIQNTAALPLSKSADFSFVTGFTSIVSGQKQIFISNNLRAVAGNRVTIVRLHSLSEIVINIRPEIILITKLQHMPGSDDPPDIS